MAGTPQLDAFFPFMIDCNASAFRLDFAAAEASTEAALVSRFGMDSQTNNWQSGCCMIVSLLCALQMRAYLKRIGGNHLRLQVWGLSQAAAPEQYEDPGEV